MVTAMGTDRPGIVSLLSERAQGFGANWAGSRMTHLAGNSPAWFISEVPHKNAMRLPPRCAGWNPRACAWSWQEARWQRHLQDGEASSWNWSRRPAGIISDLSKNLVERGVSIEDMRTEIVGAAARGSTCSR